MRTLTAVQAAQRIGVSEKTIRLWVQSGKLKATHLAKNRLAIPESEVEQIARERQSQAEQSAPATDVNELAAKVAALESRLSDIERLVTEKAIETPYPIATSDYIARPARAPRRETAREPLPPGAMLARDFAEKHGVNPRTFVDHLVKGIGGQRIPAEQRPKLGRPGETERYLLPEQQRQALDVWKRNGVRFTMPEDNDQDQE